MPRRIMALPPRQWTDCLTLARLALAAVLAGATPGGSAGAQTPIVGAHAGGPIRASLVAGVWIGDDPRREDANGALIAVEPGLRGGRVSIGYAYALSTMGSFVTARASALRTWRVPTGPRTYLGLEAQFLPLLATGPRLSAFLPADHNPRRLLWMLDGGIGF